MGRGRRQGQSSRSVLLGKRRISRKNEAFLFESWEGETKTSVYRDHLGNRIVRGKEDSKWVEQIENKQSVTKIYAYPGDLDFDPVGDSVLVEKTVNNQNGFTRSFHYSNDDDELIVRSKENANEPVYRTSSERGVETTRVCLWREGEILYREEKRLKVSGGNEVKRFRNGKLDSFDGRAAIEKYNRDGYLVSEEYYREGELTSVEDRPAIIDYNAYGELLTETWMKNGEKHRLFAPAVKSYASGLVLSREEHWVEGKNIRSKRDSGPSIVQYYPSGEVQKKTWTKEVESNISDETILGYGQSDGGPGEVEYFQNGKIKSEKWFEWSEEAIANKEVGPKKDLSRVDEPAEIIYRESGELRKEYYAIDGEWSKVVDYSPEGKPVKITPYENGKAVPVFQTPKKL